MSRWADNFKAVILYDRELHGSLCMHTHKLVYSTSGQTERMLPVALTTGPSHLPVDQPIPPLNCHLRFTIDVYRASLLCCGYRRNHPEHCPKRTRCSLCLLQADTEFNRERSGCTSK